MRCNFINFKEELTVAKLREVLRKELHPAQVELASGSNALSDERLFFVISRRITRQGIHVGCCPRTDAVREVSVMTEGSHLAW